MAAVLARLEARLVVGGLALAGRVARLAAAVPAAAEEPARERESAAARRRERSKVYDREEEGGVRKGG